MITQLFCSYFDVAAGGTFFSLKVGEAKELIKKMISNQGWSDERLQLKKGWMHTVNEVNMLSAKIVLLMNKIDERATFKKDHEVIQHFAAAHAIEEDDPRCDVCGGLEEMTILGQ